MSDRRLGERRCGKSETVLADAVTTGGTSIGDLKKVQFLTGRIYWIVLHHDCPE